MHSMAVSMLNSKYALTSGAQVQSSEYTFFLLSTIVYQLTRVWPSVTLSTSVVYVVWEDQKCQANKLNFTLYKALSKPTFVPRALCIKQAARVRACNYINLKPIGIIEPLLIITRTAQLCVDINRCC